MRKDKYARLIRKIESDARWDVHSAKSAIEFTRDILRETKQRLDDALRGEDYIRELRERIIQKTEQLTSLEAKLERAEARLKEVLAR
jgi:sugar-specific transcriptional regulator TrmB